MADVHCLLVNYSSKQFLNNNIIFRKTNVFPVAVYPFHSLPPLELFISIAWMAAVRQNHKENTKNTPLMKTVEGNDFPTSIRFIFLADFWIRYASLITILLIGPAQLVFHPYPRHRGSYRADHMRCLHFDIQRRPFDGVQPTCLPCIIPVHSVDLDHFFKARMLLFVSLLSWKVRSYWHGQG